MKDSKITIGSTVRLRHPRRERDYGQAKVAMSYEPEIEGGVRLDRPLAGFVSWNVADLKAP